ncbi:hypothetical protein [Streptomyces fructofermentans]|uniref:hypothetical protein n=1 Tax=Streptomyces fructofermentans TaxID=152141 RepID=UPI0037B42A19
MQTGLQGRGALFDTDPPGLAPRLVGLPASEHRPGAGGPPDDLPFVVLTGGRGLGKSAALGELLAAYKGHTPVALIDCEDRQFAGPPPRRPPGSWSAVSQALLAVAEQLAEPATGAGRIPFPRLTAGLLAVAASGWGDRDLPRIRQEAERVLLLNDTGSWRAGIAGRWVGRVSARLTEALSGTGPVVEPIIEATLEVFSEGVSPTHRRLRRAATWYRDYPNAAGSPKLGLVLLSGHFRTDGDSRTHAEHHLVRALLADLGDAYAGALQRSQRPGRPVVLIDNAQTGPGTGLIGSVLRDRADGIADRVVFFAGLRAHGHPSLLNATRRALPEVARSNGWAHGGTASSGALLVPLPPLSADDTAHIVGTACRGVPVPPLLPPATHRLTGGSPLGTALLAESARQNLPRGAASPGELLTAGLSLRGEHGTRPAYRELLDRLMPGDHPDELTVLAAAHDRASACALADALLPDGFGALGVLGLEERLAAEGVPAAPGYFVGDPFLRTLLLLALYRREPGHDTWRSAHRTLVAHYAPAPGAGAGRARHRLRHELALGTTGPAVAHLRDGFHLTGADQWLAELAAIASAPYPGPHGPDGPGPDDRTEIALGGTDADTRPPDGADAGLHLRVRRLLHGVWQVRDPLALPVPAVAERLGRELEQLAELRPADGEALRRASRDWPADALAALPLRLPGDDEGRLP